MRHRERKVMKLCQSVILISKRIENIQIKVGTESWWANI
jgi:hypothetical protein